MEALSEATTRMTEGEILQLHKTGDPSITIDEYYKDQSLQKQAYLSQRPAASAPYSRASLKTAKTRWQISDSGPG